MKRKILAVDDEEFNLDIITDYLEGAGFDVVTADDGDVALEKLAEHNDISVIILDRMMPKINGIEVINVLKNDDRYKNIPIVMQTASAQSDQVIEGIKTGVYYYLTKPYNGALLLAIVNAALKDLSRFQEIELAIKKNNDIPKFIQKCEFKFCTLEEAKSLAYFISNSFPDPSIAAFGLNELMINAIEHGNLGITYAEKTKFLLEGNLYEEIERRLTLEEYKYKKVTLDFTVTDNTINVYIKDQGHGFDWKRYLDISPKRVTDPHGRGIAISKFCFSKIDYIGKGNEVLCTAENTMNNVSA